MLVGSDSEFVVEAVMPYFFHVVPVVDDAVLDGEAELEDTLLGLSLFSDVGFLVHADHDVLVFGSADQGGER